MPRRMSLRRRVRTAVGTGVFHVNDCDPFCAEGTFHHRKGRLTLRDRVWCSDVGEHFFKKARVRYCRPLLGEDTVRWPLVGCPL